MSFLELLEQLIIGPLKLVFEIVFSGAFYVSKNPGLSIIALSLVMNVLVLPLYRQADAMQEKARDTDAKLRRGVDHIKKTFSGDERMMILQTYYRQNNYRPTDALNGSVSLLLEIPFFMAAYQFLSHSQILSGVSFGPIQDLGAPDGMLVIGGLAINLLPILMTAINCVSSAIYLKGFPMKTKIQLYGMALFFLVFLYTSPAGLVFYWTLNNLFSLAKNIFYKLKNPKKVLRILGFVLGLVVAVCSLFLLTGKSLKIRAVAVVLGLAMAAPFILSVIRKYLPKRARKTCAQATPDRRAFVISGAFLTVLIGALIPSAIIASSPQEFVDIGYFYHPLWYVACATALAAGTFLIWLGVFYWLADSKWKVLFQRLIWVLCGVMLVDYLFFGTNLGTLTSQLQYEAGLTFSAKETLINLLVILFIAAVLYLAAKKWNRIVIPVLLTALIAIGSMSVLNIVQIKQSVDKIVMDGYEEDMQIPLSKDGKNVVVLMLDRAMGEYVPYLFNEKPELEEKFDGFTYYPNTISFGGFTNFGAPAIFGGYEYTPVEMNKRSDEALVDKHNESLLLMPTLFADNGGKVTVCNPTYANYQWKPDLSIYDDNPQIQAYIAEGTITDKEQKMESVVENKRRFFLFSIMKSAPVVTQNSIYRAIHSTVMKGKVQVVESLSTASGISYAIDYYRVLANLSSVTTVSDSPQNTFFMLSNDTTHDPMLLQEPDYVPAAVVDNTEYDAAHQDRFTLNGKTLTMETDLQLMHYQTNMAVMLRLGEWFDYLREQGVYDNTRIIIVSDHGRHLGHLEELMITTDHYSDDLELYLPLLMVKDFGSTGFTISDAFMTNADVPTLATEGVIENPTNPFTGKAINNDEKFAHDQFIIQSRVYDVNENCGNTFLPSYWASVSGNPWDLNNWTFYDEICTLDRHAAP